MITKEELEYLVKIWHTQVKDDSWSFVIFEHGTCVVFQDPKEDIETYVKEVLKKWGPVVPGTDLGDFSVHDIEDEPVWLVTYSHPDITNFVTLKEIANEADDDSIGNTMVIGMTGRNKRVEDAKTLKVIYTEDRHSQENV
ncbi:MAG: hypothetical protein ACTSPM_13680 [Candidatus Heimdallarchaeota archaeon]